MKLNRQKFGEEIGLFIARLTTTDDAKHAMKFAEHETKERLLAMSEKTGHPIERVLLTAICGELRTRREQQEFTTRLILLNILTEGT